MGQFGQFKLNTSEALAHVKAVDLADTTLLSPDTANHIVAGEWIAPSTAAGAYARAAAGSPVAVPVLRTPTDPRNQIPGKVVAVVTDNWHGETTCYKSDEVYPVGTLLKVGTFTVSGQTYYGLIPATSTDSAVAVVTKAPTTPGDYDWMGIKPVRVTMA